MQLGEVFFELISTFHEEINQILNLFLLSYCETTRQNSHNKLIKTIIKTYIYTQGL